MQPLATEAARRVETEGAVEGVPFNCINWATVHMGAYEGSRNGIPVIHGTIAALSTKREVVAAYALSLIQSWSDWEVGVVGRDWSAYGIVREKTNLELHLMGPDRTISAIWITSHKLKPTPRVRECRVGDLHIYSDIVRVIQTVYDRRSPRTLFFEDAEGRIATTPLFFRPSVLDGVQAIGQLLKGMMTFRMPESWENHSAFASVERDVDHETMVMCFLVSLVSIAHFWRQTSDG